MSGLCNLHILPPPLKVTQSCHSPGAFLLSVLPHSTPLRYRIFHRSLLPWPEHRSAPSSTHQSALLAKMAAQNAIANQFQPLFQELETDRSLSDCIREKSKELDQTYRSLSSLLNSIHSTKGSEFDSLIQSSLPLISRCRSQIRDLAELVPQGGYYRWCDDFSFSLRSVASSLILIHLLATGSLLTKHEAAIILGLSEAHVDSSKLMLSTEDYLHATINAINELARLAVNSVTLADFRTPLRLASFVKEVHAAFQLLNLKNDSLRKRFDGLKVCLNADRKGSTVANIHIAFTFSAVAAVRCEKNRRGSIRYFLTRPHPTGPGYGWTRFGFCSFSYRTRCLGGQTRF